MNNKSDVAEVLRAAGAKFKNGKVRMSDVNKVLAGMVDNLLSVQEVSSDYTAKGCVSRFLLSFSGQPGAETVSKTFADNVDRVQQSFSAFLMASDLPFEAAEFSLFKATDANAWVDICFCYRKKPFLPSEAIEEVMSSLFVMADKSTY